MRGRRVSAVASLAKCAERHQQKVAGGIHLAGHGIQRRSHPHDLSTGSLILTFMACYQRNQPQQSALQPVCVAGALRKFADVSLLLC
jgi:hypothetical protein